MPTPGPDSDFDSDSESLNNLLAITLSFDSSDPSDPSDTPSGTPSAPPLAHPARRRDAQSEPEFQAIKSVYRPKLENGEIWRTISPLRDLLPAHPPHPSNSSSTSTSTSAPVTIPKHHAQALLHAIEELYFFRRYDEGLRVARGFLEQDRDFLSSYSSSASAPSPRSGVNSRSTSGGLLDPETRELLRTYEGMCLRKLEDSLQKSAS